MGSEPLRGPTSPVLAVRLWVGYLALLSLFPRGSDTSDQPCLLQGFVSVHSAKCSAHQEAVQGWGDPLWSCHFI